MKSISILATSILTFALISCGSKYAKVNIKDANSESTYVYGDIKGPAKQLKNSYPNATPESVDKAINFRALVESELVSAKK